MMATKLFDSIIMLRFGSDKSSKKRKEILWSKEKKDLRC